MRWLTNNTRLNTLILIIFGLAWLYTEVEEQTECDVWQAKNVAVYKEFRAFHDAGGRFTAAQGDGLEARIKQLEQEIDELTGD